MSFKCRITRNTDIFTSHFREVALGLSNCCEKNKAILANFFQSRKFPQKIPIGIDSRGYYGSKDTKMALGLVGVDTFICIQSLCYCR